MKGSILISIFLAIFSGSCVTQGREILQTAADGVLIEGDMGVLGENTTAAPVYQTVSSNYGSLQTYASSSGWSVTAVNATIELSTTTSYAYTYQSGSGTSRFNVTVNLSKGSGAQSNPPPVTASISNTTCGGAVQTSLLLSNATSQPLQYLTIVGANNSFSTSGNLTASTVYQELIEYEDAQAVGIYVNNNLVACQDLQPPFPDFPNDWSATIEITNEINGSTFVLVEQYAQSLNQMRLDVHSLGANYIITTNTNSSTSTFINPQNGSCSARTSRRTNWITGQNNVTLLSTAELLHFSPNQFHYVQGFYEVRGIVCDLWRADVSFSNNWANVTLTALYYFPIDQWLVAREDYHRMLKQAELNGTWNGHPFEQTMSYIDFRPRTFTPPTFETCAISPYGSGCNCTAALRRAAFSNVQNFEDSESDGNNFEVNGDLSALCGATVPHGFISAQSGPYVGLTIIGMIGGSLITGIAMYIFYRKRTGVSITDNLGHQKFTDAPGS